MGFASEAVGEGADWTSWGLFGVPGELTTKQTIQLREILMNGNVDLFNNIYWQHLAFLRDGVEILKKFKDVTVHPTQLEAWKALEKGIESGNQEDIWRSATLIADFEQNEFLQQKVYDPSMELWKEITGYAEGLSVWGYELGLFQDFAGRFFIGSPVPGDNNQGGRKRREHRF